MLLEKLLQVVGDLLLCGRKPGLSLLNAAVLGAKP
jgi:hypothetical protein